MIERDRKIERQKETSTVREIEIGAEKEKKVFERERKPSHNLQ